MGMIIVISKLYNSNLYTLSTHPLQQKAWPSPHTRSPKKSKVSLLNDMAGIGISSIHHQAMMSSLSLQF